MFGFGKKTAYKKALSILEKMASGDWQCSGCDGIHTGLPDLGTTYPDAAGVPKEPEPNSALRTDSTFLSEDFCVLNGEYYFIRTVLRFPIKGRDDEFGFGVWSSLSKTNFDLYVEKFDEGFPMDEEIFWTSWFMTNLAYFKDTFKAKSWVAPQANRQRPVVWFAEEDHPIYRKQREGLEPTELLDIYRHYGCWPKQ